MTSLGKYPEAAWALREGRPWTLEMFGGVADAATDDLPALAAAARTAKKGT